jgi:hypothetical protein
VRGVIVIYKIDLASLDFSKARGQMGARMGVVDQFWK